jgi:hypothetical protein
MEQFEQIYDKTRLKEGAEDGSSIARSLIMRKISMPQMDELSYRLAKLQPKSGVTKEAFARIVKRMLVDQAKKIADEVVEELKY